MKRLSISVTGNRWTAKVSDEDCARILSEWYGGTPIVEVDGLHITREHIITIKVTTVDEEAEERRRLELLRYS